jgi:acetyl-CoA C-acetyltransferase
MLTGPSYVTEKAAEARRHEGEDIDLFELNEAFASVVLRFMKAC